MARKECFNQQSYDLHLLLINSISWGRLHRRLCAACVAPMENLHMHDASHWAASLLLNPTDVEPHTFTALGVPKFVVLHEKPHSCTIRHLQLDNELVQSHRVAESRQSSLQGPFPRFPSSAIGRHIPGNTLVCFRDEC